MSKDKDRMFKSFEHGKAVATYLLSNSPERCAPLTFDSWYSDLIKEEPTELQIAQWQNEALTNALQYLVDTKERKDTIGKDSIYMQRKNLGWMKAKNLLTSLKE